MAEEPSSKPKRRVRNPDTFRERAVKANQSVEKPRKAHRLRKAVITPFRFIGSKVKGSPLWKLLGPVLRFIGKLLRFITPPYIRNSWKELRLVNWPNWKQSRQLTGAVLIFAVVFGISIALVDYGLDKLFRNLLLK